MLLQNKQHMQEPPSTRNATTYLWRNASDTIVMTGKRAHIIMMGAMSTAYSGPSTYGPAVTDAVKSASPSPQARSLLNPMHLCGRESKNYGNCRIEYRIKPPGIPVWERGEELWELPNRISNQAPGYGSNVHFWLFTNNGLSFIIAPIHMGSPIGRNFCTCFLIKNMLSHLILLTGPAN